ncbi:MAG: hypothetical protein QM783_19880 [Phycisphaerales bacterium]
MKCKRCEYPLWDMASRVCPECGLAFSPEDYTFVVNSVRFMCPHCRQDYYGTGQGGHLLPNAFVCVKCGVPVREAQMIVLPTAGVSEVQTVGGAAAWREKKRNLFYRFFVTIGQVSFAPHRFARYCGEEARPAEAWVFAGVSVLFCWLMGFGWCGALQFFFGSARLGRQATGIDLAMLAWSMVLWIVLPLAGVLVGTAVWAMSAHAVLAFKNPRPVPMAKTMELFGYSLGALFLAGVPIVGPFMLSPLAGAWVAVSAIIQMCVRQRVEAGRAVIACLALPAVVLVGLIGWAVIAASMT